MILETHDDGSPSSRSSPAPPPPLCLRSDASGLKRWLFFKITTMGKTQGPESDCVLPSKALPGWGSWGQPAAPQSPSHPTTVALTAQKDPSQAVK
ncbi:unnamed protein product [Merluccius merluccius]